MRNFAASSSVGIGTGIRNANDNKRGLNDNLNNNFKGSAISKLNENSYKVNTKILDKEENFNKLMNKTNVNVNLNGLNGNVKGNISENLNKNNNKLAGKIGNVPFTNKDNNYAPRKNRVYYTHGKMNKNGFIIMETNDITDEIIKKTNKLLSYDRKIEISGGQFKKLVGDENKVDGNVNDRKDSEVKSKEKVKKSIPPKKTNVPTTTKLSGNPFKKSADDGDSFYDSEYYSENSNDEIDKNNEYDELDDNEENEDYTEYEEDEYNDSNQLLKNSLNNKNKNHDYYDDNDIDDLDENDDFDGEAEEFEESSDQDDEAFLIEEKVKLIFEIDKFTKLLHIYNYNTNLKYPSNFDFKDFYKYINDEEDMRRKEIHQINNYITFLEYKQQHHYDDKFGVTKYIIYRDKYIEKKKKEEMNMIIIDLAEYNYINVNGRECSVSVNSKDILSLGDGQYLNDNIIDYYIEYLIHSQKKEKEFFNFSPLFFSTLLGSNMSDYLDWNSYNRKQTINWKKAYNKFNFKFWIFPIVNNFHWSCVVIVNPLKIINCVMSLILEPKKNEIETEKTKRISQEREGFKFNFNNSEKNELNNNSELKGFEISFNQNIMTNESSSNFQSNIASELNLNDNLLTKTNISIKNYDSIGFNSNIDENRKIAEKNEFLEVNINNSNNAKISSPDKKIVEKTDEILNENLQNNIQSSQENSNNFPIEINSNNNNEIMNNSNQNFKDNFDNEPRSKMDIDEIVQTSKNDSQKNDNLNKNEILVDHLNTNKICDNIRINNKNDEVSKNEDLPIKYNIDDVLNDYLNKRNVLSNKSNNCNDESESKNKIQIDMNLNSNDVFENLKDEEKIHKDNFEIPNNENHDNNVIHNENNSTENLNVNKTEYPTETDSKNKLNLILNFENMQINENDLLSQINTNFFSMSENKIPELVKQIEEGIFDYDYPCLIYLDSLVDRNNYLENTMKRFLIYDFIDKFQKGKIEEILSGQNQYSSDPKMVIQTQTFLENIDKVKNLIVDKDIFAIDISSKIKVLNPNVSKF